MLADNTLTARAVRADARSVRGLLKSPHGKPLTVGQMDQGVAQLLAAKHARPASLRKSA